MSLNRQFSNTPKHKRALLSPSYLSEEDLESYIATEIEEMKKYFAKGLKKCQTEGNRHLQSITDKETLKKSENVIDAKSNAMLEKLKTVKAKVVSSDCSKDVTNEIRALRTKIELTEAQYHTFMKEIEKQPKGVFKVKERVSLKKKLKELECTYSTFMKTLRKQLQQSEGGSKEDDAKVDTIEKIMNHQIENGNNLHQKNAVLDVIPITAAKINTVLEQMNAVNEDIKNLGRIKIETDRYLQNLKCTLKDRINPYNKKWQKSGSDRKQMSLETAGKIMSQIELDISYINYEHDNLVNEMLQLKEITATNLKELEKLNVLVNILLYKLYEVQLDHRKSVERLHKERSKLLLNTNMTKDDLSVLLSDIDRKQRELNDTYNLTYLSLQGQIDEIEEEASTKVAPDTFTSVTFERIQSAGVCKEPNTTPLNSVNRDTMYLNSPVADCFKNFVNAVLSKHNLSLFEIDK